MEVRDIQMNYTIDNPKLVDNVFFFKENNFTGVIKDGLSNIAYYENGECHRTDGPALINCIGGKDWFIHNKHHREDGPAVEYYNGYKEWWYNGKYYGRNNNFTVESWIEKWKFEIFK